MSLTFNDSTNFKGIVQLYEKEIGVPRGHISGDTNRLEELTADVNIAYDDFLRVAIPASGKWQFDDTNFTDFPIIKTNLVSGQADYTFTDDEDGNLILDIYKVMTLPDAASTIFDELRVVDQQQIDQFDLDDDIATEIGTTGTPWRYDKTANGIILDPKPNYTATNGLKVYINREPSYFVSTDTTKKPGVDGRLHKYFYLRPSLEYKRRNKVIGYSEYKDAVRELNDEVEDIYGERGRDTRPAMNPDPICYE